MYIFIYIQGSVIKLNLYSFLNSPSFLKKKTLRDWQNWCKVRNLFFFFVFTNFACYANCI